MVGIKGSVILRRSGALPANVQADDEASMRRATHGAGGADAELELVNRRLALLRSNKAAQVRGADTRCGPRGGRAPGREASKDKCKGEGKRQGRHKKKEEQEAI